MESRVSRVALKYLIEQFPVEHVRELGSQGVEMKRMSINQTMKEFDKKVSNLVFDLEAKDSAENALWIKEVE